MSTDENMREVVGGIASLIAEQMTDKLPIPLGDSSYAIVHMGYLDGDPQILLRTNADDVWILRVQRLGQNLTWNGADDVRAVLESYQRYQGLIDRKDEAMRIANACGFADSPDMVLQAFFDEVLSDDERECWLRWSPGGYATKQELGIIAQANERNRDRRV